MAWPGGQLRQGRLSVENPVQAGSGVWLVTAVQAGVNPRPQVFCERLVDARDALGHRADGFLHGDPGAFLAGAGGPGASTQAGCTGEFVHKCIAFGADGFQPADVGPLLSLGEFLLKIAEPLTVRVECLPVQEVTQS
jgi:hypothetical protein